MPQVQPVRLPPPSADPPPRGQFPLMVVQNANNLQAIQAAYRSPVAPFGEGLQARMFQMDPRATVPIRLSTEPIGTGPRQPGMVTDAASFGSTMGNSDESDSMQAIPVAPVASPDGHAHHLPKRSLIDGKDPDLKCRRDLSPQVSVFAGFFLCFRFISALS